MDNREYANGLAVNITSSADGSKLAAVDGYNGNIWLSTDGGSTWSAQAGGAPTTASWKEITSSADGIKLAAQCGVAWISTDGGSTWSRATSAVDWSSLVFSGDGTTLVGCVNGGNIWLSTDDGATWSAQAGGAPTTGGWVGVASSADGTKLTACISGDNQHVWRSNDSGATWSQQLQGSFRAIASSADGMKLAACDVSTGHIWVSSTGGVRWIELTGTLSYGWKAIASSADGSKLAVIVGGNGTIRLAS